MNTDVIQEIFLYLPYEDLLQLSRINKAIYARCQLLLFWTRKLILDFNFPPELLPQSSLSVREIYHRLVAIKSYNRPFQMAREKGYSAKACAAASYEATRILEKYRKTTIQYVQRRAQKSLGSRLPYTIIIEMGWLRDPPRELSPDFIRKLHLPDLHLCDIIAFKPLEYYYVYYMMLKPGIFVHLHCSDLGEILIPYSLHSSPYLLRTILGLSILALPISPLYAGMEF